MNEVNDSSGYIFNLQLINLWNLWIRPIHYSAHVPAVRGTLQVWGTSTETLSIVTRSFGGSKTAHMDHHFPTSDAKAGQHQINISHRIVLESFVE